jgi:hypothetical protein
MKFDKKKALLAGIAAAILGWGCNCAVHVGTNGEFLSIGV